MLLMFVKDLTLGFFNIIIYFLNATKFLRGLVSIINYYSFGKFMRKDLEKKLLNIHLMQLIEKNFVRKMSRRFCDNIE